MKFALQGKDLLVTAENPEEVKEVIKHYSLDVFQYVSAVSTGFLQYTSKARRRDNAQWFTLEAQIGPEWLTPYMDKLRHITGYTGPIPTIEDAPRYGWHHIDYLCHTHIVEKAQISPLGYLASGFLECGDWNGKLAADRAMPYFVGCIKSGLGDTKHEPEMICLNNGLFKKNPNYMKQHAPHPAAKSLAIFLAIFNWWRTEVATPGQREALDQAEEAYRCISKSKTAFVESLMRGYSGFHKAYTNDSSGYVTFTQFKEL